MKPPSPPLAEHWPKSWTELVADAAGVGFWTVDLETGAVEWNHQMYRIYGLRPEDPAPHVERWLGELVHPEDRESLQRKRRRSLESGEEGTESEFRVLRPDGSVRWVVCRLRRERIDGRLISRGLHIDVTERRLAEMELSRVQARAAAATAAAGVGIWEYDLTSGETQWNDQMYRLRGLAPDDPRPATELRALTMHPDDRVEMQRRFQLAFTQALAGSTTAFDDEVDYRVVLPDGSVRWMASRGSAVWRNAAGSPQKVLGVNWDITARKQAEQAQQENLVAERANRAKSQFLSRMSHEFRTPLNAMLGFTQVLLADPAQPLSAQQRDRLGRVLAAGEHLLAMIEDLLDVAQIDTGGLHVSCGATDIAPVLRAAVQAIAPAAERAQVRVSVDTPGTGTGACAWCEPRRLRQVLDKLLSNAVKYNRSGGEVRVRLLEQPRGGLPGWCLTVRDTGRGLSEQQRSRLFEPFNRLGVENEVVDGTGLGLALARQLVLLMGGQIEVDSRVGEGSEFRVWLRAATPHPPLPHSSDLSSR
jgi:PAS domain S-box-containing protein